MRVNIDFGSVLPGQNLQKTVQYTKRIPQFQWPVENQVLLHFTP